ncbi:MAG TPA: hypothetical protein VG962_08935 [Steroidobacteraceae bacterium]|nr:hypothetical protein [Steroidobacteraceae bacterium]
MKYWTLRIVGFLLGAGMAVALEIGLLLLIDAMFDRELMPRGLGWLFIPIAVGTGASSIAPIIWLRIERGEFPLAQKFRSAPVFMRASIVFPLLWILCLGAYVALFNPYGYMTDDNYWHMFKVMLFPPVGVLVGALLYRKLIGPSDVEK